MIQGWRFWLMLAITSAVIFWLSLAASGYQEDLRVAKDKITLLQQQAKLSRQDLMVARLENVVVEGKIEPFTPENAPAIGWALMLGNGYLTEVDSISRVDEVLANDKVVRQLKVMRSDYGPASILFDGDPRAVHRLRVTAQIWGDDGEQKSFSQTFSQVVPASNGPHPSVYQIRYVPVP